MPRHMYFAFSVLNTLFHSIFDAVRSAVRVVSLPGYLIRFPPAVSRTRFGSFFCGQKLTTSRAYVTTRSFGMFRICSWVSTKIESVPGVFVFSSPCAMLPNSLPSAVAQMSRMTGSRWSFLYCVMTSPVTG